MVTAADVQAEYYKIESTNQWVTPDDAFDGRRWNADTRVIEDVTYSIGEVEVVEDFGGEGKGDQRYVVIKVTNDGHEQFFRYDGYYSSYDGTDWDGEWYEVFPVEKTVIEYEKKTVEGHDSWDSSNSWD